MFDVGFTEILLLLVIALIVLGPERLPGAARTIGAYVRRARNAWLQVKFDIDRELQNAEIQKAWRETMSEAGDLKGTQQELEKEFRETQQAMREAEHGIQQATRDVNSEIKQATKAPTDSAKHESS
ncbi:MAG: Sec-independent protein translocase protein TatB [Xanthomonadales bacterium]|nr:Sec-independent protein translocase protein TatB [Xanthomonadales bacterium]